MGRWPMANNAAKKPRHQGNKLGRGTLESRFAASIGIAFI